MSKASDGGGAAGVGNGRAEQASGAEGMTDAEARARLSDRDTPFGDDEAGAPKGLDLNRFGDKAKAELNAYTAARHHSPTMADMYDRVGRPAGLNHRDFRRAMVALHHKGTLSLGGWPKSVGEIPKPKLATRLGGKVVYYVHPKA